MTHHLKRKRQKGFTLMEVLVAIMILAGLFSCDLNLLEWQLHAGKEGEPL
jgi:prepilin-type N-terminal cleavage/methylation domain-containing protein